MLRFLASKVASFVSHSFHFPIQLDEPTEHYRHEIVSSFISDRKNEIEKLQNTQFEISNSNVPVTRQPAPQISRNL